MKINSLYIASFGKIKNLKLDFSENFNLIYGDNENGKSTVMAFIKMMFYGSDRGSAKLSKNIRKKYTPWDNSSMAGSIDFTHEGKNYRLEREFRSSNSTDKVTLCDLDFGTRIAQSGDIGIKFFGLSSAAFDRSVFIGQFGFPENDSEAEGEINSKLSNMVLTGDESVSFETVSARLEKAKLTLMSKSGKAGLYDKNVIRYNQLLQKKESLKELSDENKRKKQDVKLVEEKIVAMEEKCRDLKSKIATENDVRNLGKLQEFLDLKAKLDQMNAELTLSDGTLADEMYLSKLRFCMAGVGKIRAAKENKQGEISAIKKGLEAGLNPPEDATPQNAENLQREIENLEQERANLRTKLDLAEKELQTAKAEKSSVFTKAMLSVITVLTGAATAVLGVLSENLLLPLIFAVATTVLLCCTVAVFLTARKKKTQKAYLRKKLETEFSKLKLESQKCEDEIFAKKVKLETVNTALNSNAAVIEKQKEMLAQARADYEKLILEENEQMEPLIKLFALYKPFVSFEEISDLMETISEKAIKQKEIKQQLNFISRDIGSISYEQAAKKLAEIKTLNFDLNSDFEKIKAEYEGLVADITEHKSAVAAAKVSIKAQNKALEETPVVEKELSVLEEKMTEQKEFCNAAQIALEVLTESFGEVRRSYGSVLEKRAGEIFANLTDGCYEGMSISKSFEISVNQKDHFGGKEIDYLSSGTADQAYLSLRLGIAQLMCEGKEQLPVMLDDSLAQYDDERMKKAVNYLNEFGKTSQIIMFTCHKNICDAASETGANAINL